MLGQLQTQAFMSWTCMQDCSTYLPIVSHASLAQMMNFGNACEPASSQLLHHSHDNCEIVNEGVQQRVLPCNVTENGCGQRCYLADQGLGEAVKPQGAGYLKP